MSTSPTHTEALPGERREYFVLLGLPIGLPQLIAGFLLLLFLAQCLWLAWASPLREMERAYVQQGLLLLQQHVVTNDAGRSPLVPLLAALPVAASAAPVARAEDSLPRFPQSWRWRVRLPFIAIGLLLGASLWYVSRRLYGNAGGYIAMAFYVFSPNMIMRAASAQPPIVAAWGAFGLIFTAIAVAHTLYAPRQVLLWNWKRILLLGLSVLLAVGAQSALAALVAVALVFMLYLVPGKRRQAVVILAAGCAAGALLLWATYAFDARALWTSLRTLRPSDFAPQLFFRSLTYSLLLRFFLRMPALLVALIMTLVTYALWPRPRFFGVTAPLLVWALLMVLGIGLPHLGGYNLFFVALPFAFVFLAGVFADLLEGSNAPLRLVILGVLTGILLAHSIFSLGGLLRLR